MEGVNNKQLNRRKKFSEMSRKYLKSLIRQGITKNKTIMSKCRRRVRSVFKATNEVLDGEFAFDHNLPSTSGTVDEIIQKTNVYYGCPFRPTSTKELSATLNQNDRSTVNLEDELRNWAIQGNISHHNFNKLLLILRKPRVSEQFIKLPVDCRTLLKSSKHNVITNSGKGQYYHFGVARGILYTLERQNSKIEKMINLDVNIDGLPLAKSSGSQFWTILGSISRNTEPFVIGVWHGHHHPDNPNEFLQDFVEECLALKNSSIHYNDKVLDFNLSKIICDAPAKSFVLGLKGHNSYFGCTKCTVEGTYKNNRMCFINDNCPLRTDNHFRSGEYGLEYHKNISPLLKLDLDLVNGVPLDYMHLVCLGVMKRLLQFWYRGNQEIRMNPVDLNKTNISLQTFKKHLSNNDFARLPRSICEVDKWKATEFRQFLLYSGPIVLHNRLKPCQYKHFLSLHCAMRILCSPKLCIRYNRFAKDLLTYFVKNYGKVYGKEYVTHNVHNLLHISDDVFNFKAEVDAFSAFKFENYMFCIKKMLKSCNKPLEQFINRINERRLYLKNADISNRETLIPELLQQNCIYLEPLLNNKVVSSYGRIKIRNFQLGCTRVDNHAVTKDEVVVKVEKIIQCLETTNIYLIVKRFHSYEEYFNEPCSSKKFSCGIVDVLSDESEILEIDEIASKCIAFRNFVISLVGGMEY